MSRSIYEDHKGSKFSTKLYTSPLRQRLEKEEAERKSQLDPESESRSSQKQSRVRQIHFGDPFSKPTTVHNFALEIRTQKFPNEKPRSQLRNHENSNKKIPEQEPYRKGFKIQVK